jgi:hypothetical protein
MIQLSLSVDALAVLTEFERNLEPRMASSKDLSDIEDWASKLKGQVVRLAGVIHAAKNLDQNGFSESEIDESTIKDAITIAEYFIPHAKHVFEVMAEPKIVQDSRSIIQWIKDLELESFKFNDCHVKFKGRLPTAKDVQAVLNHLIERNFIRPTQGAQKERGRPPRIYEVNPSLFRD